MHIARLVPARSTRAEPRDEALVTVEPARISFRHPVTTSWFIDAAWWPRSLDLTHEVPPLLEVLWAAGREITRITYNSAAWDPAPHQIHIDGRTVHLGGCSTSDPLTVRLSDPWRREPIELLVIAPATDPAAARVRCAWGANRTARAGPKTSGDGPQTRQRPAP